MGCELENQQCGIVVHPDDDIWDSVYDAVEMYLKKFDGKRKDIVHWFMHYTLLSCLA